MSYTLYGFPRSGSMAIEMAMAELDLDYVLQDVDLHTHAQRNAAFAQINPQRKLPALITPDGETLTESVAILLTLDQRYPDAALLPHKPAERAQALRWLMFVATEIIPSWKSTTTQTALHQRGLQGPKCAKSLGQSGVSVGG